MHMFQNHKIAMIREILVKKFKTYFKSPTSENKKGKTKKSKQQKHTSTFQLYIIEKKMGEKVVK